MEQHLLQTHVLRTSKLKGINGIAPFYCQHESLCRTRKAFEPFGPKQIVQIGHWVSCPHVNQRPMCIRSKARLVCTELMPGSLKLVELSPGIEPRQCLGRIDELLWIPCADTWVPPVWSSVERFGHRHAPGVWSWSANDFSIRQVPQSRPFALAWHLVFDMPVFRNASTSFLKHDIYWSTIDDNNMPANKYEMSMDLENICYACACALDGSRPFLKRPFSEDISLEGHADPQANAEAQPSEAHTAEPEAQAEQAKAAEPVFKLKIIFRALPECLSLEYFFN